MNPNCGLIGANSPYYMHFTSMSCSRITRWYYPVTAVSCKGTYDGAAWSGVVRCCAHFRFAITLFAGYPKDQGGVAWREVPSYNSTNSYSACVALTCCHVWYTSAVGAAFYWAASLLSCSSRQAAAKHPEYLLPPLSNLDCSG